MVRLLCRDQSRIVDTLDTKTLDCAPQDGN